MRVAPPPPPRYPLSYNTLQLSCHYGLWLDRSRVSTEFRQHGIPRNFLTSEVISAKFRRNSAKFRGIPRNFAGIEPEITSVFRGMPKCHFRGHPRPKLCRRKSRNLLWPVQPWWVTCLWGACWWGWPGGSPALPDTWWWSSGHTCGQPKEK